MAKKGLASRAVQTLIAAAVVALVAGQLLGQPVLLGFVETGSMAPALQAGDGFVAVPAAVAGPVERGDVVTYRTDQTNDGDLTTHRVVRETDRGFVTRGDANSFTDQSAGEPPVKAQQVVAVVWAPGGSVFRLPGLGTAVAGLRSVVGAGQQTVAGLLGTDALLGTSGGIWLIAGLSAALYVAEVFSDTEPARDAERTTDRDDGRDVRLLIAGFALVLVAGTTVAMVAPSGTHEHGFVSAEFDSEQPTIVRAGEEATVRQPIRNTGVVPVRVYIEGGDGPTTQIGPQRFNLGSGAVRNASVLFRAPAETGYYRQVVTERRYLLVLPPSVLDKLYAIHPWVPWLAIDALVGGGFYLFGRAAVGRRQVIMRRYVRADRDDR